MFVFVSFLLLLLLLGGGGGVFSFSSFFSLCLSLFLSSLPQSRKVQLPTKSLQTTEEDDGVINAL